MKNENILKKPVSRRSFILGISAVGTGSALGLFPSVNMTAKLFASDEKGVQAFAPNVFLQIDEDNTITFTIARSELGQGIRTTFSMILAEELDADWDNITAVQAVGDSKYGSQSTGGSTSVRNFWHTLRIGGGTARDMLITAAAETWGIGKSDCRTENSFVFEINGSRKLSYGELADKASKLPIPPAGQITLKQKSEYKLIGTDKIHIDNPEIVNGKAIFGMDKKIPGMKYVVLAQRPAFGASVRSFDDSDTLKIPGVIQTLQQPEGVAVIADNTWAAMKGVEALKIDWNLGNNAQYDSDDISQSLYDKIGTSPELPDDTVKTLDVVYEVPFLSHATMEPMNATAHYHDGKLDMWTPSQDPQSTRNQLAGSLGMNLNDIMVTTTLVGGGFGRRLSTDYSVLAGRIAKATGIPVKVVYSRADDMKHDYYRPASVHAMKGGVDASGNITGWHHKGIFAGGGNTYAPPYHLPNPRNTNDSGLGFVPTGAWRSVDNTQVCFANECFLDEFAIAGGHDPLDFRKSIVANSRLSNILDILKEKSEWTKPLPSGWGRGVALFMGYSAYIGHVIEVSVINGKLQVERIVAVVDPGLAINPRNIDSQTMGASNDGLSTAIKAEITIKNGGVVQSNFSDFEWIRIDEVPKFESYVINEGTSPSGMGEVGFPSVSPALCNAIFDATGVRIRKLPIKDQKLTTSVEEEKNDSAELEVFPNPFTDRVRIEFNTNDGPGLIAITAGNLKGQKLIEINRFSNGQGRFSDELVLNNLSSGTYILSVSYNGKTRTAKIIRE